jgi:hypothetical protein
MLADGEALLDLDQERARRCRGGEIVIQWDLLAAAPRPPQRPSAQSPPARPLRTTEFSELERFDERVDHANRSGFEPLVPAYMDDAFKTSLVAWLAFAFLTERPTRSRGGTDGSNPLCSSGESANHRFLSGAGAVWNAGLKN